jgi:rRNA small subunit methyltransferase G.
MKKATIKAIFLREVSQKLKLKTEIIQKNIFELKKIQTGTIMSRAFKPIPVVLDLVYKNFSSYKNIIFFLGKNGKEVFKNSLKDWELEYIEKKSLTNEDSFLVNIKKMKRK